MTVYTPKNGIILDLTEPPIEYMTPDPPVEPVPLDTKDESEEIEESEEDPDEEKQKTQELFRKMWAILHKLEGQSPASASESVGT